MDIRGKVIDALSKIGLFKRRMIHVARKFGAISKWADFSNISLDQLKKSFEGTAIFEESIKETLEKDMNLKQSIIILEGVSDGIIDVVILENKGEATPIAQLGIEKIGRRTNLIPPEKIGHITIEVAKARLLNEVRTFVCTKCWKFIQMMKITDLPEEPHCPNCGAGEIGVLDEEEGIASKICEKHGESLTGKEKKLQDQAIETSKLVSKYGKPAVLILVGKRLMVSHVENILSGGEVLGERLFKLIVEEEKRALLERFW
jgi:ATP-dependent Lhr-like helicase